VTSDTQSEWWLQEVETRSHPLVYERMLKGEDKIRIALLDTGIDLQHGYFQNQLRKRRVKECKSFVASPRGDRDANGHGTHAAALIMRVAPSADIYVARVIEDDGTVDNPKKIADAIRHAISVWKVDIISMSFGYGQAPLVIQEAISEPRSRDVYMFAAASNTGRNSAIGESFPARASGVISVFATDGWGGPASFNPPTTTNHTRYSTLGVDVTAAWRTSGGADTYKCKTGSSVATPIMVGCAAMGLEYVRQKPPLVIDKLQSLRGLELMKLLLSLMTNSEDRQPLGYVAPWFWFDNTAEKTPFERLVDRLDRYYS